MNRKQRRAQGQGKDKAKQPAVSPGKAADPFPLHEAGIAAYRAGQLASAADLIAQAIALTPAVPEFHYNLAIVFKAMGQLEAAAASYERAIALKPDHVNAHNNLGNVWKALGRNEKARAAFVQALAHNPANADTHYSLGLLCCEEGEAARAEHHFRRCLESDPQDRRGIQLLLAHLGAGQAPQHTPQAHLLNLYDLRSRFWDQEQSYFAPALVADALRRHAPHSGQDILDIGCGTGLVGVLVRDLARQLDGVDLSPAMLGKAEAKAVYDRLFEQDLLSVLEARGKSYDAVLGAAALIHFGELEALFEAAAGALRDNGLFIFTLFAAQEETAAGYSVAANTRLAQSGCFWHSPDYVKRLAAQTGFSVLELDEIVHEHDQDDQPVAGLLAVLKR